MNTIDALTKVLEERRNALFLGPPGIGKNHLEGIYKDSGANNVQIVAACDLFSKRRDWAKEKAGLKDADLYIDYRKMLERKDLDAVVVATPDVWHANASCDAMEAGKHVYCEKPMTRYLGEAFRVYDVVKKTGKSVNMEQLHWWTFNSQMMVSRMRHYEDTAQVLNASVLARM